MKKAITLLFCASLFTLFSSYASTDNQPNSKENSTDTVNDEISLLCKAVIKGDIDQVRSLIAIGEELNEKSLGLTPAMYAARYNKAEVMKVLLLNGANLNIKSDQGYTAKDYAKMSNAKDVLVVIEQDS
jgi:ankyrin repeat protein